ncbi:MAG TPA: VOC family protein [Actinotalea sp.]|nr:VOC family protein [Actinotalea sp.]
MTDHAPALTRPADRTIAADTAMGPVTLHVADLDAMTAYYRDVITLQVLTAQGDVVTLGRGGLPLVVLRHGPHLAAASPNQAGLFHTAILFEDAAALAGALASVARHGAATYTGSADHLVSLAFYLTDPEGNGVELYVDRPRDQWQWRGGQVQMATLALDPDAFIQRHLTPGAAEQPEAAGAVVGHVHLQVGDIPTARGFYVDTLGFTPTFSMGSALFVSAGGYHHHLAVNTWRSAGAARRPITLGLGEVTIEVPDDDEVGRLRERLTERALPLRDDGATLSVDDPWGNVVRVRSA